MTKRKAKKEAKKIALIYSQECYVIRIKVPFKWYIISSWFTFYQYQNVSQDYIHNTSFTGKKYFTTKT